MEPHDKLGKQITSRSKAEKKERFLDFLRAAPTSRELLWSHAAYLKRVATLRASSATHFLRRAPAFVRTVDWHAVRSRCVAWTRQPMNAALLVWLAFVAGGVAFVFLLMTGALNSAVPDASRRKRWTEVANQVLNALFTLMCVYQHPRLCHHVILLCRWRVADIADLRAVYCKNTTTSSDVKSERVHVAFVVVLLHVTCLAQYAYCALFWLFRSDTRPDWAVNLCMALGLGVPIIAALYMVYGPLGKKQEEEAIMAVQVQREEELKVVVVTTTTPERKEWAGGLFDFADDPAVAVLSASCTFCVFGWNMERMGMGNMYVHVFTFALLCAAPVLVFAVAALNIHDATLGFLVGAAGAALSVLGLLYGGYWRARMRRRFGLPADRSMCGGRPAAADYAKWLFCAPCALAQEVRTANLYDVEEGPSMEEKPAMPLLEREGCVAPLMSGNSAVECVITVDAPPVPVMVQEMDR